MDNLVEKYFPTDHWLIEKHTAELIRDTSISSSVDIHILARRLAETHDDMQRFAAEIRQLTKQVEMQRSLLNTLPVDDIPTSKWLDNYLQYRREQESSASDSQRSEP